jgi:hypothetical protein
MVLSAEQLGLAVFEPCKREREPLGLVCVGREAFAAFLVSAEQLERNLVALGLASGGVREQFGKPQPVQVVRWDRYRAHSSC